MGSSRSPYSIRDQLRLEPSTFGCDQQHAKKLLKQFMDKARQPRADGGLDLVFLSTLNKQTQHQADYSALV